MDKKKVIESAIAALERELREVSDNIQHLHATANNAPSPMESWSDSTRRERQSMALDMETARAALQNTILFLQNRNIGEVMKAAENGSLIKVQEGNTSQLYFLVPFGGGKIIDADGIACMVISSESKIGSSLIGKKAHDVVSVVLPGGARTMSIESIA